MSSPISAVTRWRTFITPALAVLALAWGITQASPAAAQSCVGDCNDDGSVTVDEIVTMVNIALGLASIDTCPAGDSNGDGMVTVDEILQAVNNALNGCPTAGCTTATVTVSLDFDSLSISPAGLTLVLDYPPDVVSIPGTGDEASVLARVTDISGVPGFVSYFDGDANEDQVDDFLRTQAVAVPSVYNPGGFESVQFDCEGESVPTPEQFTCSITEASDIFVNPIDTSLIGCSVSVATP